jgi:magnesium chelatase family protein
LASFDSVTHIRSHVRKTIGLPHIRSNAAVSGAVLEDVARPDASGLSLLREAADLDGADKVGRVHLAEALSYRALTDEIRRAA